MNYIEQIRKRMEEAGTDCVTLLYDRRKTTIQKDGIRYEILDIYKPDEGDTELSLATVPSYGFRLVHLCVDATWRESTWDKLLRIAEKRTEGAL